MTFFEKNKPLEMLYKSQKLFQNTLINELHSQISCQLKKTLGTPLSKTLLAIAMAFFTEGFILAEISPLKAASEQEALVPFSPSEIAIFTPPKDWRLAETETLPLSVKVMVVGKGEHAFSPSINMGTEPYQGTLKEYLQLIKAINESKGAEWRDLGTIRTEAGNASLSQLDVKTEWGDVRMMHVILIKNKLVYILTAAALKEEFPKFYPDFFTSMRSLRWSVKPKNGS